MFYEFVRDGAVSAAVLGFFASAWFGWAQERPPARWRVPLTVGSGLGLAVAVVGGVVAWRNWGSGSVLDDAGTYRAYLIILGVEFGIAAIGAVALLLRRRAQFLAPWICLVVGVHFVPLAPVLASPGLYVLAALLTAVALLAVPVARRRELVISAPTGVCAGGTLLVFAAGSALTLLA